MTCHYGVCLGGQATMLEGPFAVIDTAIHRARALGTKHLYLTIVHFDRDRHGLEARTLRAFVTAGAVHWASPCVRCSGLGYKEHASWGGTVTRHDCESCNGYGALPDEEPTLRTLSTTP